LKLDNPSTVSLSLVEIPLIDFPLSLEDSLHRLIQIVDCPNDGIQLLHCPNGLLFPDHSLRDSMLQERIGRASRSASELPDGVTQLPSTLSSLQVASPLLAAAGFKQCTISCKFVNGLVYVRTHIPNHEVTGVYWP
jgi:hypothetical protein